MSRLSRNTPYTFLVQMTAFSRFSILETSLCWSFNCTNHSGLCYNNFSLRVNINLRGGESLLLYPLLLLLCYHHHCCCQLGTRRIIRGREGISRINFLVWACRMMINNHIVAVVLVFWVIIIIINTNANSIGDRDGGVGVGGIWGPVLGRGGGRGNVGGRCEGVCCCPCCHWIPPLGHTE